MNSNLLIVLIPAAMAAGMMIAWLLAKSNAAATITGLQTRLADTAQLITTKQQEVTELMRKYETAQQQLGTVQQASAALNKQVELGQLTLEELKQQLAQTVQELREKQNLLTETVQAKATAAASLQEAGKTIAEMQRREADWQADAARLRAQVTAAKEENATLEANYQATTQRLAEQQQFVEQAQQSLKDAFGALSADALKSNNDSFVALAKATLEEKVTEAKGELEKKHQAIDAVVKPLAESLTKMDEKINVLETKREGAYSQMNTLLDQMKQSTVALDKETRSLVNALKSSTSRGRYGEIALRRLVEFAGMLEHCDFEEQVSTETTTGRLRPDMIIRLPESRRIVVDSKVPLAAYLEMFETEDQLLQKQLMDKHIAAIKTHIKELGSKAYWDQFADAPDFVVLFMQIESSFGAALQVWPGMIEEALNNRIIIATPTTLITILRSIGYSWSQLSTIENIEAIRDAAVELYERSATLMEHFTNIGRGLTGTINHYNKAIGSLEAGFLPQGRKINQLAQGFTKKQLSAITPIDVTAREIVAAPPVTASLPINDNTALNAMENKP